MSESGPDLDLGEAQWAVEYGQQVAHWFARAPNRELIVVTTCGQRIAAPLLFHPGTFTLCRHCASRHRAPNRRFVSPRVADWLNRACAPPDADRTRS